jgi:hypothetical protein
MVRNSMDIVKVRKNEMSMKKKKLPGSLSVYGSAMRAKPTLSVELTGANLT